MKNEWSHSQGWKKTGNRGTCSPETLFHFLLNAKSREHVPQNFYYWPVFWGTCSPYLFITNQIFTYLGEFAVLRTPLKEQNFTVPETSWEQFSRYQRILWSHFHGARDPFAAIFTVQETHWLKQFSQCLRLHWSYFMVLETPLEGFSQCWRLFFVLETGSWSLWHL